MTAFDEYEQHDAVGLAAAIRAGDVTAHEVLEATWILYRVGRAR